MRELWLERRAGEFEEVVQRAVMPKYAAEMPLPRQVGQNAFLFLAHIAVAILHLWKRNATSTPRNHKVGPTGKNAIRLQVRGLQLVSLPAVRHVSDFAEREQATHHHKHVPLDHALAHVCGSDRLGVHMEGISGQRREVGDKGHDIELPLLTSVGCLCRRHSYVDFATEGSSPVP